MVLQDASNRAPSNLDVEIAQRAMNAGVTPTGVFPCHPYDELFNVDLSARPRNEQRHKVSRPPRHRLMTQVVIGPATTAATPPRVIAPSTRSIGAISTRFPTPGSSPNSGPPQLSCACL